jgi:hypothetical protein
MQIDMANALAVLLQLEHAARCLSNVATWQQLM